MTYRVIVTGSRDWTDARPIYVALDQVLRAHPDLVVVEGGASGADLISKRWALWNDVRWEEYLADWAKHGKGAGPIRNQVMVDKGADEVLAFPLERSVGTWDCVRRAKAADIVVHVYKDGDPWPPPTSGGRPERVMS